MAFTHNSLRLLLPRINGGIAVYTYKTADSLAIVTAPLYWALAGDAGVVLGDILIVEDQQNVNPSITHRFVSNTGLAFTTVAVGALIPGNINIMADLFRAQGLTGAISILPPSTVAQLPTASAALKGLYGFVTDANSVTFQATAVGGGANNVPVFCDGTAWKIG